MLVADLVGKDKSKVSYEEMKYLLSTDIIKMTNLYNEDIHITICEFEDGSFTKTIDGTECKSSKKELEKLIESGKYTVEDEPVYSSSDEI